MKLFNYELKNNLKKTFDETQYIAGQQTNIIKGKVKKTDTYIDKYIYSFLFFFLITIFINISIFQSNNASFMVVIDIISIFYLTFLGSKIINYYNNLSILEKQGQKKGTLSIKEEYLTDSNLDKKIKLTDITDIIIGNYSITLVENNNLLFYPKTLEKDFIKKAKQKEINIINLENKNGTSIN